MHGAGLIAIERNEQIVKHGRTIKQDVEQNPDRELADAASLLIAKSFTDRDRVEYESWGWDKELWRKMATKPYRERLIIAGALIAAEIDRLNAISE